LCQRDHLRETEKGDDQRDRPESSIHVLLDPLDAREYRLSDHDFQIEKYRFMMATTPVYASLPICLQR